MSVEESPVRDVRGAGGPDRQGDGSGSRLSKNNRQAHAHRAETANLGVDPDDLPEGTAHRPVSVEAGVTLRDEARLVDKGEGVKIPLSSDMVEVEDGDEIQARSWYRVVGEFRNWYHDYLSSHIEFEDEDGEVVRTELENSYMPSYGDRYYAKLMDLQRGVERRWDGMTTVMLTVSASTLNANGDPRCPADHMREIADGWDVARKQLHQILDGRTWAYARVWEPTTGEGTRGPGGYGHMHVAVFVEDGDDLDAEDFEPFMRSYVSECDPAGWDAHDPAGDSVSVVQELEDATLGTYISEYIGSYGKETLERPMYEQAFYAVTWATRTRRVEFSSDAQDVIAGEEFRRETGLRPEDRGEAGSDGEVTESDSEGGESDEEDEDEGDEGWTLRGMCTVKRGSPSYYDPTSGVIEAGEIDGRPGVDPPRDVGGPPPG